MIIIIMEVFMNTVTALFFILIAGLINGAFALPSKYTKKWSFENSWLLYAFWAFLILPWLTAAILAPHILSVYAAAPSKLIWVMVIGGFLFGTGQVGFALAIEMIGIGLSFVLGLGIGTGLGFLLPLVFQHPAELLTPFGLVTLLGTLLALIGIIVSTYAGQLRDRSHQQEIKRSPHFYLIGVILASIAGLFSAGQNFSFSLTVGLQDIAQSMHVNPLGASLIMWPGFLVFTLIPYAIYMIYLIKKNRSCSKYCETGTKRYYLYTLIMGACWFGSLIFYSRASQLIGKMGPVVGWPLFMVLIILCSNLIGWKQGEWDRCDRKTALTLIAGILFLVISVVVLGYSSTLHP